MAMATAVDNSRLTKSSLVGAIGLTLGIVVILAGVVLFGAFASASFAAIVPGILLVSAVGVIGMAIYNFVSKSRQGQFQTILFAILEGALVGSFSYLMSTGDLSIVGTAVLATTIAVVVSHLMYTTGVVRVTSKFRSVVAAATIAAAIFYLIAFVLSLFGVYIIPTGGLGIALSLVMIVIACSNVIVDSDDAAKAIGQGAPDDVKWTLAYSSTASIVWVYIEMLRLVRNISN